MVWLDLPIRIWVPRLARRTWRRARSRELLWNGNRESLGSVFWGRDSLVLWALRSHFRRRREYPQALSHLHVIRLTTSTEVERFLSEANSLTSASPHVVRGAPRAG